MGGTSSKSSSASDNGFFMSRLKSSLDDEIARKMMLQREIQMAVNISRTRDIVQIYGSAWGALVAGFSAAKLAGRNPPSLLLAPIIIGGFQLGNLADMAYGNKLNRVTKEAEHILEHERARLVPMKQAPFAKFYTASERGELHDTVPAAGELLPSSLLFDQWRSGSVLEKEEEEFDEEEKSDATKLLF